MTYAKRVFSCTDVAGVWPVGFAAVMIARDRFQAFEILTDLCREHPELDLPRDDCEIVEIGLKNGTGVILVDGDY